ncbi:MAG TPA: hypothetical protein VK961_09570 [Chthoniobacter sp.]|nr:hypothetical protein [Chthoniobacter sp.]
MKYLPPLALALVLTSCAITPEDKQDAHQRKLQKEARENFIAMKAQEHPGRDVVLNDEARPTPKPGLFASSAPQPAPASRSHSAQPTPVTRPVFASNPEPWYAHPTHSLASRDDTVYYWQVESARSRTTPRERAAEAKYAQKLAKRPENLSPEERLWAHEHY